MPGTLSILGIIPPQEHSRLPSLGMASQRLRCFLAGTTDQQLHFRIALERIHGHDYARHAALRKTADPHINAAAITSSGLGQEAVIQRIANVWVLRMGAALRPVDDDLRGGNQVVRV
jgi:hypothetical protein